MGVRGDPGRPLLRIGVGTGSGHGGAVPAGASGQLAARSAVDERTHVIRRRVLRVEDEGTLATGPVGDGPQQLLWANLLLGDLPRDCGGGGEQRLETLEGGRSVLVFGQEG